MSVFAISWISDVSLYLGAPLGLWLSFRVLGYPDLSLEYLFVLGGALFALQAGKPWGVLSITLSIALLAVFLGFATSFIRNRLNIHPILISLAAAYLYYSTALVLLGSPNRYFGNLVVSPSPLKVTIVAVSSFLVAVALLGLGAQTEAGLRVLACGANPTLSRRYGLSPTLWQGVGLALSFLLVMMSGAFFAWRAGSIDVSHGSGLLLISIFVVVLTRAMQKRVQPWKNFAGILLALLVYLGVLQMALWTGMPPQWLRGVNGAALLLMVILLPRKEAQLLRI